MVSNLWLAPTASKAVVGTVAVPGSKSITNRALVLSALSDGPSRLRNVLKSRDSELMISALRQLGARVVQTSSGEIAGPGEIAVTPLTSEPGGVSPDKVTPDEVAPDDITKVNCGLAGTVMRFVPPVAALSRGRFHFYGDEAAKTRPMAPLISALEQLGVPIAGTNLGQLPFEMRATGHVRQQLVTIDSSGSSQFISALLLASARYDQGLLLRHQGPPLPSLPHIQMTVRMLNQHGVQIAADTADATQAQWQVPAGPVSAMDRIVEPDLSNAMPFVAAAIVTGGTVTIPDWPEESLQPIERVANVFANLGAEIGIRNGNLVATGTGSISGINANLGDIGELVPTVVALCALGNRESHITGIGHLAGHETDRLSALVTEINALGGKVKVEASGLKITPRPLRASSPWHTYQDHRMATAGAILGLAVPGIQIENIDTTSKTFPHFPQTWRQVVQAEAGNGVQ